MFAELFRKAALWSGPMVLAGALAGSAAFAGAKQANSPVEPELFITEIFVDFDGTCSGDPETLITGGNFDNGDPPEVTLGNDPTLLTICPPVSATVIVAKPSADVPGVALHIGPSVRQYDAYDLTLGAVGRGGAARRSGTLLR